MPAAALDSPLAAAVRALRPHQWAKNGLVALPAALAHRLGEPEVAAEVALAVVAMSAVASGTYVVNDLADRDRDRAHPTKRRRPFASGALGTGAGVALAVALVGGGFALGAALPAGFLAVLATYVAVTLAYSLGLKRVAVLDVHVLAGLYALRLAAGAAATGTPLSEWFVVFSLFFFLGLAVLKRYAEVRQIAGGRAPADNGRGYRATDGPILAALGVGCGLLAVLVLALYVTAPEVRALYAHPAALWVVVPAVLYWTARAWLLAHRGDLPDDPVLFAVTDPQTLGLLAAVTAAVALAAR